MDNLKDYREKELKTFVIANILVILYLIGTITFDGIIEKDSYIQLLIMVINSGLFSSIIYAMVTVCDCMISNYLKRFIIFWWTPIPGETIFTDIKINTKDNRFTTSEVSEVYKEIYNNMPKDKRDCFKYQNSKWYSLLSKYESESKVQVAHRDYLMCRDMATSTILMLIVYLMLSLIFNLIIFNSKAIIYLLVVYLICVIAARTKSKRFVKTVIACDIHSSK